MAFPEGRIEVSHPRLRLRLEGQAKKGQPREMSQERLVIAYPSAALCVDLYHPSPAQSKPAASKSLAGNEGDRLTKLTNNTNISVRIRVIYAGCDRSLTRHRGLQLFWTGDGRVVARARVKHTTGTVQMTFKP